MSYKKEPLEGLSGAAFSVGVTDNSMEPYLMCGGTMYVARDCDLVPGDVGLFLVGGELVCRQYVEDSEGNIYLFALNRKRRELDITLTADSGAEATCLGRVILPERPALPGE